MQVTCSCGFVGNAPSALAGKHVRCRRCGASLTVPFPPNDFADLELPKTKVHPRTRKIRRLKVAFALIVLSGLAVAGLLLYPAVRSVVAPNDEDVVTRHIKSKLGEPGSFQLVQAYPPQAVTIQDYSEWREHFVALRIAPEVRDIPPGPATVVRMTYRAKNPIGAMIVWDGAYIVRGDKVIADMSWKNWTGETQDIRQFLANQKRTVDDILSVTKRR
jgi:hypothetical protein